MEQYKDKNTIVQKIISNIKDLECSCEDCPFHYIDKDGYTMCMLNAQVSYIDENGLVEKQECTLSEDLLKERLK